MDSFEKADNEQLPGALHRDISTVASESMASLVATSTPPPEEGLLTVDVFQTADELVIQSAIAGVESKDLDVSIAKDMVTIKGKRKKTEKIKAKDYFHQELYWEAFSRAIILPMDINVDRARASIKNGLLTIRLPKREVDH